MGPIRGTDLTTAMDWCALILAFVVHRSCCSVGPFGAPILGLSVRCHAGTVPWLLLLGCLVDMVLPVGCVMDGGVGSARRSVAAIDTLASATA